VSLKVYLRPEAETDIEEAAIWYEEQRQGLGQEFLDDVLSLCETISENPAIYPRGPQAYPPRLDSSVSIWSLLSD
jgi:plasmid stabilization system protein ParE